MDEQLEVATANAAAEPATITKPRHLTSSSGDYG